ncbi:hypothetical protein V492_04870 [Pseudogymnoascus sp. VKM F-4246]|nr:hypothetical protein V492_04870 [Pseudogymnoascus sp. VKM F-4246]
MDKNNPKNATNGASYVAREKEEKYIQNFPFGVSFDKREREEESFEDAVLGASYETHEREERTFGGALIGASFEMRERVDKYSENASCGASYTARDSISASDRIELYTGKSSDPLPLVSPIDSALAEDRDRVYPPMSQVILVMSSLLVSMFLVALDRTIIATAIPKITDEYGSLNDIGWYESAFMLSGSAPLLLFGKVYTFYSPKWLLLIAMGLFEIGNLICGMAPSSIILIVGRAVAGLGASGIFTGCVVGVQHVLPLQKRPMAIGIFGTVFAIASVIGPLLGGALTDAFGWRWCFYLNVPIGGVSMVVLAIALKLPAPATAESGFTKKFLQLDPLGTISFMPGLCAILLAVQWGGNKYPWDDIVIIVLFIFGAILIIIFIGVQIWLQDDATVPPRILKNRSVASGFCFSLCVGASFIVCVIYLAIYFQSVKGVSAVQSGIDTIPLLLATSFGAVVGGAAVSHIGYYAPFMLAGPPIMAVGAGLLTTFHVKTPVSQWVGYQVIFGFGCGICMQQPGVAAQRVLSRKDIATGSALMMFAQQVSGSLFVPIAQSIFQNCLIGKLAAVPGLDIKAIMGAGATKLREIVPPSHMDFVLDAFNDALVATFFVVTAASGIALLPALAMEWLSVKVKKEDAGGEKIPMGDMGA